MKNSLLAIFIAVLISLTLGIGTTEASIMKQSHHVGLHDRLLTIEDVRVIDNDMKVPLHEIAKVLYIPVETKAGNTIIRKHGVEIVYNEATNMILQDGKELTWSPILEIDGTIFVSVKYIARVTGFKVEYFQKQKTLRIYRDDYPHMSHSDYEKHIAKLLKKKEESQASTKPTVYLTFDDGPNKYTTINNRTLKEHNVKGTFFFLGNHMKKNEKIVQTVADAGHYIGSHSMTHDQHKVYKSPRSFINEMSGGIDLIHEITGIDSKLIRVPYGSKPHVTPAMQQELSELGYKMWDWNVDSNDWKYTDKQADKIVENVQKGVQKAYKSGERNIIILMHDRSQTTKALPDIIKWLQQEGYTIKSYEPDRHFTQNFLNDITL